MRSMIWKSTFREIKESLGRFLAILAIVALGVGFFAGLKVTQPAMLKTAQRYFDKTALYDYRLISTVGFSEDEVETIKKQKDVKAAEGAVTFDIVCESGGKERVLKMHSITEDVNRLVLVDGELPENAGECVVDSNLYGASMIGKTIKLSDGNDEDDLEHFSNREYKITGIVQSPLYSQFERGSTSLGNGRVSGFVYLLPEGFADDYYTEVYVKFACDFPLYSEEYDAYIEQKQDAWEALTEDLAAERYQTVRSEAETKLADGKKQLAEKKEETKSQLDDAKKQLEDAKSQIEDGEKQLADAKKKLEYAPDELEKKEAELTEAEKAIQEKETQMGTALCAFNKGTFLLMGSNKGDALSLKGSLLSLMRQDAENSYVKTTDFGKLASAKGEVVTVMNMSFIPNDITMQMRMGMPADLKLEDIKYLVSATFEKGKIVVDVETLIENKDLIAMYEKQSAASSCIKGACLEYFPANTLVWAGGNINGKGIYDLLCENPTIRQALDNSMLPIDIEGIFSSIHGDVAVGYNSLSNNDLLIYADVTNKDFLQSFEDLKPLLAMTGGQMQLNSTGKDQYEFRMYRQSIWFGVKDNLLYISNNERLADEAGRRYGVSLQNTPWAGQVTKNRFFMAFNAAQLVKDVQENPRLTRMLGSDAAMFNAILGPCDYMDVMAPDWKSAQMNIVMKDKEVNVLQLIVRGLENL